MGQRQEPDPDDTLNALAGAIEAFHKIREYMQLVSPETNSPGPETAPQGTASEQRLECTSSTLGLDPGVTHGLP